MAALPRGVDANLAATNIDAPTAGVMRDVIRMARLTDLAPLIDVMPFAKVRRGANRVTPAAAANPFSAEHQIFSPRRSCFDTTDF